MSASIKYRLSQAGQKAAILAGQSGEAVQVVKLQPTDPNYPKLVSLASIDANGNALLDLTIASTFDHDFAGPPKYDDVPSVETLLGAIDAYAAEKLAKKAAEREQNRQRTLEVLEKRATRRGVFYLGEGENYETNEPAWFYCCDPEVQNSPEAKAWAAELEAANEKAKEEATARFAAKVEAAKRAKEAAEKSEAERRAALGLRPGDIDFDVDAGALTEVPDGLWQTHKRGRNWFATITVDPGSPGGLARSFAAKAKGDYFYVLPTLLVGEAIEFGADYYTGSGKKSASRWYGYVVSVSPERVVLHECSTGKAAVKAGAAYVADLAIQS